MSFKHPLFLSGNANLIFEIKRKQQKIPILKLELANKNINGKNTVFLNKQKFKATIEEGNRKSKELQKMIDSTRRRYQAIKRQRKKIDNFNLNLEVQSVKARQLIENQLLQLIIILNELISSTKVREKTAVALTETQVEVNEEVHNLISFIRNFLLQIEIKQEEKKASLTDEQSNQSSSCFKEEQIYSANWLDSPVFVNGNLKDEGSEGSSIGGLLERNA